MNTPPDADTEELTRFLHRFADLMSTGTNADNLLRAAKLLESQVDLARKSTEQLPNCSGGRAGAILILPCAR